jgi:hypothetical protein
MYKLRTWHTLALLIFTKALLAAAPAVSDGATPNDTARFLAGMTVAAGSPLEPLTRDRAFSQHSEFFDRAFATLDANQLSKVRAWSSENLQNPQPTLFYMFSGPDFLYANAFFPAASTYVMSGLELPGEIPDAATLPRTLLPHELAGLRASMNSVLNLSFFITNEMSRRLYGRRLTGTLPVLFVFLARSGKTIKEVSFVTLDKDGAVLPADGAAVQARRRVRGAAASTATGVKITFLGEDNRLQTLYYFRTDLSNRGTSDSGFLKFCEQLGAGDSFIKSASYLPQSEAFSNVRNFLLKQSATIVQDDTGLLLRNFDVAEWDVKPFGNYVVPIPLFRRQYQPNMHSFFVKANAKPLQFGIGYHKRANVSSLVLAMKKPDAHGQASSDAQVRTEAH